MVTRRGYFYKDNVDKAWMEIFLTLTNSKSRNSPGMGMKLYPRKK